MTPLQGGFTQATFAPLINRESVPSLFYFLLLLIFFFNFIDNIQNFSLVVIPTLKEKQTSKRYQSMTKEILSTK